MKRLVDVEIMGEKFTVRSDADDAEVRKVAGYVDGKIQEALKGGRAPLGKSSLVILAALNIAEEYHRLKDEHEAVLDRLHGLSKRLSKTLTEEG